MANYTSYKKVTAAQVPDGSITIEKLANGVGPSWCVKTFYGTPSVCTPGCCCNWTVPSGVAKLTWELWGAGGNGHGKPVPVEDVITTEVLVEVPSPPKQSVLVKTVHIQYVLLEFTDVTPENVLDVTDVHHMLMDIT